MLATAWAGVRPGCGGTSGVARAKIVINRNNMGASPGSVRAGLCAARAVPYWPSRGTRDFGGFLFLKSHDGTARAPILHGQRPTAELGGTGPRAGSERCRNPFFEWSHAVPFFWT